MTPLSASMAVAVAIIALMACVAPLANAVPVKCVLNPYYIPVCGSDNNTYGNHDLLNCYNRQRTRARQIRLRSYGECESMICPSYEDLTGPWWTFRWTSVCGNDGRTYGHINQVRCLLDFQPTLAVLHEGGCSLYEVRKALGRHLKRKACAEKTRNFEKNPICTQNNVTFSNPFEALCTRPPGGIREKVGGLCGSPEQRSCEKVVEIQRMLRDSPAADREQFLVCGNDLRTYRTQYHLECSKRFNVHLFLKHHGRCKKTNPCPDKLKFTLVPTPVCGSNQKSYVSYDALVCAQRRMARDLTYLHAGACAKSP